MLKALGIDGRRDLALFFAIISLVAITPVGEGTIPLVLVSHRLLLVAITIGCFYTLREHTETRVSPGFVGVCVLTLSLMLVSLFWNPGSRFDGFYRWYQHLFFGAAFLAMAEMHRRRGYNWKRSILWAVVAIDLIYMLVDLILGRRPLIGPFVNPNYFASFLLVGFCATIALTLFEKERIQRIVAAGCALLLYYGMTQAWSRGATIAALAVAGLAFIRFSKDRGLSRAAVAAFVGVAVVAGALASPSLIRKFLDRGQIDPYNYQRPQLWLSAIKVIQENPVLGVGFGQFYYVSKRFSPPVEGTVARYLKRPAIAHNEYLQYAAENGIPAALLFLSLGGHLFSIAWRRARQCSAEQRIYQEAAILTAVGLGTHALVDNNWTVPVVAAGLLVFSLGDVLPVRSWSFKFQLPTRGLVLASIALLLIVVDGILLPGAAVYFNESGHTAYTKGQLASAESSHRLATALIPNHDVFLDNAAMVYLDKYIESKDRRWMDYAETLFLQAMSVNPNADNPARHLETLYIQQLTGDGAKDKLIHLKIAEVDQHILRIDPYNPFVRKNLAESLYNLGSRDAARDELARAIELEPNYIPGYLRIAEWFRDAGHFSASDDYQQKAFALATRYQHFQAVEPYEAMLLGRPLSHED